MSLVVVRGFGFSLSLILLVSSGVVAQRSYDDNSNTQQAAATANITQGPVIQYADDQFAVITWTTDQPFVSRVSAAEIVYGTLAEGATIKVESQMPEGGVIFSDGIEKDYLAFNSGAVATIAVSPRKAHLVA